MPKTLRLVHSLGRCGSTLVSACLASLPRVVLISEVHPRLSVYPPLDQARSHDLVGEADVEAWKDLSFGDQLARIAERAEQRKLLLVVRGWTYLDFLDGNSRSSIVDACKDKFEHIRRACLVREPVDQWRSHLAFASDPRLADLDYFMAMYRRFAEMAESTYYVKYEDFAANPVVSLLRLCARLDLPYAGVVDACLPEAWKECSSLSGDLTSLHRHDQIEVHPRKPITTDVLAKLRHIDDYRTACRLLNYPPR